MSRSWDQVSIMDGHEGSHGRYAMCMTIPNRSFRANEPILELVHDMSFKRMLGKNCVN